MQPSSPLFAVGCWHWQPKVWKDRTAHQDRRRRTFFQPLGIERWWRYAPFTTKAECLRSWLHGKSWRCQSPCWHPRVENRKDSQFPLSNLRSKGSQQNWVCGVAGFGYGPWNDISGFVALKSGFKHRAKCFFLARGRDTGFKAPVSRNPDIQERFKGAIYFRWRCDCIHHHDERRRQKDYSSDAHKVDGMSGATLTGKGLNKYVGWLF